MVILCTNNWRRLWEANKKLCQQTTIAPRNKGSRISTLANHPDEETSNRATTTLDAAIMMAEMEKRIGEQKDQAAAAMQTMQKRFERQMQAIRNEN